MTLSYPATLANLKTRVRGRLLTSSGATDHWPEVSDKIRTALNRAQVEVQMELLQVFDARYFVKTDETLTPSQGVIFLPEDLIRLLTFEKDVGDSTSAWLPVIMAAPARVVEYRYHTPLVYQNVAGTIDREVWSLIGDKLECAYKDVTGTYRLRWVYRIKDLQTDDDESEIPPQYHDLLVDNAAWRSAKDAGEDARAARLAEDYQRSMELMKRTAGRVNPTAQHRIRETYSNGRWRL